MEKNKSVSFFIKLSDAGRGRPTKLLSQDLLSLLREPFDGGFKRQMVLFDFGVEGGTG